MKTSRPLAWAPVLLLVLAAAGAVQAEEIVLRKPDGGAVAVQTTGPLADDRAVALARDIRRFDAANPAREAFAAIDDAELRQALLALAAGLRNDAVGRLDLAYRVAQRTSAGLDDRLLAPGFEAMKKLSELLSRPPVRLHVNSQIGTAVAGARLWFMGLPDYLRRSDAWESYTPGQPMRLGSYQFRLTGPGSLGPRCQQVDVMADPMVATLDPPDCPPGRP